MTNTPQKTNQGIFSRFAIHKSLAWKLTLAFLLVAFIATALVAISIRVTSTDRLSQLIIDQQLSGVQEILTDYYISHGSWDTIQSDWDNLILPRGTQSNSMMPMGRDMHGNFRDRRNLFGLASTQGVVLISADPEAPRGTHLSQDVLNQNTALIVNGQQVGTILISQRPLGLNIEESQFLERTGQALLLASLGALLIALVLSFLLSRSLTQSLKALTHAAQKIADGQLEQQVKIHSKDEIGQLANTFNRMSQEVARANQQRRQMTADIAHDLRTPLTVIGGYIEAMRDEVLQPTPERMDLIYNEIERLQRMVGDLRMLSQADAGELSLHPQAIAVRGLLQRACELFQHQAEQNGIHLVVEMDADPITLPEENRLSSQELIIQVDEARMMQVLDNLISNAFRYTPPGGFITLSAYRRENQARLCVQDTGCGIPPEEIKAVFERFYRAERSRHSETGESGLGLAIVKALVEAQGGHIWAESVVDKGTQISMEFPLSD